MKINSDQRFMSAGDVCTRYGGISSMTLWRWAAKSDLGFPTPIKICGRRFFAIADLDAFDAGRSMKQDQRNGVA